MSSRTDGPLSPEEERSLLAAEFVLGVLDPAEWEAAQARLSSDPAFAEEVSAWEARLGPLADEVPPTPAPDAVWHRIAARLLVRDTRPAPLRTRQAGLWESLAFWRAFAGLATAASVALAIALAVLPAPREAQGPVLMAALAPAGSQGAFLISIGPGDALVAHPVSLDAPPARVPELWLVRAEGDPLSLGVLAPGERTVATLPPQLSAGLREGATLAVTLEPPGGAPEGRPTGPIIAQGPLISR